MRFTLDTAKDSLNTAKDSLNTARDSFYKLYKKIDPQKKTSHFVKSHPSASTSLLATAFSAVGQIAIYHLGEMIPASKWNKDFKGFKASDFALIAALNTAIASGIKTNSKWILIAELTASTVAVRALLFNFGITKRI